MERRGHRVNPHYPRTWAGIAASAGIGVARAKVWERKGAPIYRDEHGIPFCSRADLHAWEVDQAQGREAGKRA